MSYQDNIKEARKLERQARQLRKKAKLKEQYVSDNLDQYVGKYYVLKMWNNYVIYVKEVSINRKYLIVDRCSHAHIESSHVYLNELNNLIPTTEEHFNKVKSMITEYRAYSDNKVIEIRSAILNTNG